MPVALRVLRSRPPVPDCETPARCPERWLQAVRARSQSDPARGALVIHPAKYRPRWPDIPVCNRPPWSTSESPSRWPRNHSPNPSTNVHSASWRLGSLPRPSSRSAAVAESSSPNLPRGRAGTRACGWSAFLPAPASPSAADTRNACASPLVFSIGLAVRCPAPLFAPDSDASFVPIPSACRRAARSSGTRPRRSSRLPEVPQALPAIVLDNGPEFRSRALAAWSEERGVRLEFIQPGKPVQNAYVESFNGRLRDECLNANWFTSLSDARRKIEAWRQDYNQQRPHSSLDYVPPAEFARTRAEMRA